MDFTSFFWVTPGSQPRNSAIWCTTKSSSAGQTLTPETSRILIGKTLTMEHSDWPKCKVTAKAGERARLQCRNPRETKHHPCMFIKGLIHTTWKYLTTFTKRKFCLSCADSWICQQKIGGQTGKARDRGKCSHRPKNRLYLHQLQQATPPTIQPISPSTARQQCAHPSD